MSPEASAIKQWRAEPWTFAYQVLGVEELDDWQLETLHALVESEKMRFALKASKGPGKSALLAMVMWWFMVTRVDPKIVATSITGDNLKDNLWTELSKWQQRSRFLKATFEWTADRVVARQHRETWWMSARTWAKSATAEQQSQTLAGIHADAVLFVLDESGGIPRAVMSAAEAGLANVDKAAGREAMLLQAGNPTLLDGPLYDACTKDRHLWWVKEISGDPDDPKRAKRVSLQWAKEMIAKYPGGRLHPIVMVDVLGKFPPGQSNALLGVEEVSAAATRCLLEREYCDEVKILGVDVARFGDDSSEIVLRQGKCSLRPKTLRKMDTMFVAGEVALSIQKHNPDAVFIDVGGMGAGVVDRCKQLGFNVIGVDFGSSAISEVQYFNRRTEMWWKLADWVRSGGCIADDSELRADLVGPTYRFTDDNRVKLEKKDDIKKRLGRSPDKADALALTFAMPVAHRGLRLSRVAAKSHHAVTEYDPYAEPTHAVTEYDPYERS